MLQSNRLKGLFLFKSSLLIFFFLYTILASSVLYAFDLSVQSENSGTVFTPEKIILPIGGAYEEYFTELTGIKAGRPVTISEIRKSVKNLLGKYLNIYTITVSFENNNLVYDFHNKVFLRKIEFKKNRKITNTELRSELSVVNSDVFAGSDVENWIGKLIEIYNLHGYFKATVKATIIKTEKPDYLDVVFDIHEGKRANLKSIRFTGDRVVSSLRLALLIGSVKGGVYNYRQLEKDIESVKTHLIKEGYVTAKASSPKIEYEAEADSVKVEVPINAGVKLEVRMSGNKSFTDRKLRSLTFFESEGGFDKDIIERSQLEIEDFYRETGFHYIKVTASKVAVSDKKVLIVFDLNEGKRVYVKKVNFSGNLFLEDDLLEKRLIIKKGNIFQPVYFDESLVDGDLKRLKAFYRSQGFMHAKIRYKLYLKPDHVRIRYFINEGIQTKLGTLKFIGNKLIDDEKFKIATAAISGVEKSDFINSEVFRESVLTVDMPNSIKYLYSRLGYIYTSVDNDVAYRDEVKFGGVVFGRLADVTYTINEDRVSVIGGITLLSGSNVKSHVILRELLFKAGEIYDYEKILQSKQNLYRLGLFKRVIIQTVHDEDNKYLKNIEVSVVDREAGFGGVGLGYANEELLKGFFELGYDNLMGVGRKIRFKGEWSQLESKNTLDFTEPWFMGWDVDAKVAVAAQTRDRDTYRLRQATISFGIEKKYSKHVTTTLFYRFEANELVDVDPAAVLSSEDTGRVDIASITPSIVLDTRDNPFNPTAGTLSSISFEDAAFVLGSEAQLLKVSGQSYFYYSPIKSIVIAFGTRFGIARNFGITDEIPLSERFLLGGRSRVRGYDQDLLGVIGETLIDGKAIGGNVMLQFNTEVRISLPWKVGVVLFVDGGEVWSAYKHVKADEIKFTVGTGLRYDTVVGPLRLDYGHKLHRDDAYRNSAGELIRESPGEFHFTLGHAF